MREVLWVSIGALAGANLRFLVSRVAVRLTVSHPLQFPWPVLFINVTGSFILGYFMMWSTQRLAIADSTVTTVSNIPSLILLIAIGFCGSYTTFSTFAYESLQLFQQGHIAAFAANLLANNLLCILGVLAGASLAKAL